MTDYQNERTKLSHRLQGISQGVGEQIAESLEGSLDIILGKIIKLSAEAEQTDSVIKKKKYLDKQKAEIEKVLNEVYQEIGKTIKATSIEVGLQAPEILNSIAKRTLKIKLSTPHLDKKIVTSWFESSQVEGLYFNEWLKKLKESATTRIIKEARQAIILTGTGNESVKRIQNALNVSQRSAAGLIENAISTMHNWAEMETYQENQDIIGQVRFSAELDRRTSPICIQLDQKIFDFQNAPVPPLHWRCRSSLVPVFREEAVEKIKGTRIARLETEGRTVKHRDGSTSTKYEKMRPQDVPETKTYSQWMRSLVTSQNSADRAFAREALGKSRFELVKSGKLKLDSLYYQGKLRNIKELKRLMK